MIYTFSIDLWSLFYFGVTLTVLTYFGRRVLNFMGTLLEVTSLSWMFVHFARKHHPFATVFMNCGYKFWQYRKEFRYQAAQVALEEEEETVIEEVER